MPPSTVALPRWLRLSLLLELVLPSLVVFAVTRELVALAVPLAGPFAARLYGHSCGVDANLPWATWGLVALGAASLGLALKRRRLWAMLPAALLWWPAWLVAAFVSALNAHS